ncbi:RNA polymerase sigma factor [Paraflavitalea pollutisoli]|uniref:RNA polymerase sigma factor n=1 Tax=Paraflavitalea pollutisoli TaxID=3034143 RepID=UPI0023EC35EB|nr:sigma-70 family RNA polymerase sigma factor [Paraflavitalea sp. H1-2-19X]
MDEATFTPSETSELLTDYSLFTGIAAGDEQAFASFYRQMVPQLRPFIFSITHSDAQVEEVIQESFLRFWLNRDKIPGLTNPRAWLFKITANLCYSLFQRSVTERKALQAVGRQAEEANSETADLIQLNFLKAALQQAVLQLSPQRRKIYLMNREQGLTADQIAVQLGLSVQTVRNTLSASLEFLRSQLNRQGYTVTILVILLLRR